LQQDPQQHSSLFSYETDISLRGAERGFPRLRLLLLLMLISAVAAFVFFAIILFATADFAYLSTGVRDLVISATHRN
jgi:hypothetical protein